MNTIKTLSPLKASLVLVLVFASTSFAHGEPNHSPAASEYRAIELRERLEEIASIERSTLSRSEKRLLRREVREIKKELAAISGGVYLSVGALILIALLLILLL